MAPRAGAGAAETAREETMTRTTDWWWAAAAAVLAACGDGDGNGPPASDFAGTWDATSMEFTERANPANHVEVIGLGATFVITLSANGTYTATITAPGEAPEVTTGTWSAGADVITIRETGMSGNMQFDYTLVGDNLTMLGGHVEFDIDDDDADEECTLDMTLVRR